MRLNPVVELDGFSIVEGQMGGSTLVKLSGNSDSAAVSPLDEYLTRLHAAVLARDGTSVRVDFTQVYFMNSASIKAFANWIHDVNNGDRPYSITLRLNPGLSWQKRTLNTLARLAPAIVRVEDALL